MTRYEFFFSFFFSENKSCKKFSLLFFREKKTIDNDWNKKIKILSLVIISCQNLNILPNILCELQFIN